MTEITRTQPICDRSRMKRQQHPRKLDPENAWLERLRASKTPVVIRMLDGVMTRGVIIAINKFSIMIDAAYSDCQTLLPAIGKPVLLLKHAIESIRPAQVDEWKGKP